MNTEQMKKYVRPRCKFSALNQRQPFWPEVLISAIGAMVAVLVAVKQRKAYRNAEENGVIYGLTTNAKKL